MDGNLAPAYGFIGLGQMGHGMAKNLRQKICDRKSGKILSLSSTTSTPLVLEQFIRDFSSSWTIIAAQCQREVAEIADVIVTSVPRANHVKELFLNPQTGLLAAQRRTPN
ncbi:hypothetical protein ABVK25_011340 [Lepraria finkii]|uniref:3-hydroxyisobutyrate dehydrogenase n=1 Tax=Lepraria finkii TaxID=1340010 RepID=A0ABR4ARB9_9LECA